MYRDDITDVTDAHVTRLQFDHVISHVLRRLAGHVISNVVSVVERVCHLPGLQNA